MVPGCPAAESCQIEVICRSCYGARQTCGLNPPNADADIVAHTLPPARVGDVLLAIDEWEIPPMTGNTAHLSTLRPMECTNTDNRWMAGNKEEKLLHLAQKVVGPPGLSSPPFLPRPHSTPLHMQSPPIFSHAPPASCPGTEVRLRIERAPEGEASGEE
eukprot:3872293-Rhodomonas_salina.1